MGFSRCAGVTGNELYALLSLDVLPKGLAFYSLGIGVLTWHGTALNLKAFFD